MTRHVCPACQARLRRGELLWACRARRWQCPVCGAFSFAVISGPRAAGLLSLLVLVCALDVAFLNIDLPFPGVLLFTAAAVVALWYFRYAAIVLVPAQENDKTG